jgi:hypothetical protein
MYKDRDLDLSNDDEMDTAPNKAESENKKNATDDTKEDDMNAQER